MKRRKNGLSLSAPCPGAGGGGVYFITAPLGMLESKQPAGAGWIIMTFAV
jgi:hypothetical protein